MKKMLLFLAIFLTLMMVAVALYLFSKPLITVTVVGPYNPLNDSVYVGGKRLEPTGAEGRVLKGTFELGNKDISLSGPYIDTYTTSINGSPFGSYNIEITTTDRSLEEILGESIEAQTVQISKERFFTDIPSFIGFITKDGVLEYDSNPSLLVFDKFERKWVDVTEQYIENRQSITVSDEATNYFGKLSND